MKGRKKERYKEFFGSFDLNGEELLFTARNIRTGQSLGLMLLCSSGTVIGALYLPMITQPQNTNPSSVLLII